MINTARGTKNMSEKLKPNPLVQAPSSHDLLHHHLRHHLGDWRLVVALDKRIGWFRKPEPPSAPVRP
jgi:hypothetical protein